MTLKPTGVVNYLLPAYTGIGLHNAKRIKRLELALPTALDYNQKKSDSSTHTAFDNTICAGLPQLASYSPYNQVRRYIASLSIGCLLTLL
jgi:hypothetical protein